MSSAAEPRQSRPQVRSWLVPAALLTLFCNAPGGAVALFFAARTEMLARAGDRAGAEAMSRLALLACVLTVPLGLALACSGYGLTALVGG